MKTPYIQGVPSHETYLRPKDGKRRSRKKCIYYRTPGNYCGKKFQECCCVGQCSFYKEGNKTKTNPLSQAESIKSKRKNKQKTTKVEIKKNEKFKYQVGDVIAHVTFGKGKILEIRGDYVDIKFDSTGVKKTLQLSYLNDERYITLWIDALKRAEMRTKL